MTINNKYNLSIYNIKKIILCSMDINLLLFKNYI